MVLYHCLARMILCFARFYCSFPDEFIFTQQATIHELAEIVKRGQLSDAQKKYLEDGEHPDEPGSTTVIDESLRKEPLCPWCISYMLLLKVATYN